MQSPLKVLFNVLVLVISFTTLNAQPGRGGRPPGGGPEEMLSREKQALYKQVTDLTEDQKLLIDGIYEEFAVTLKETFEEMRQTNDREARREKMQSLRKEKDDLIADVLSEEQYAIYTSLTSRRGRRSRAADGANPEGQ